MEFKSSVIEIGGTKYLLLSKEVVAFLELEVGAEQVIMKDYEKTKGRFVAFWKNKEKK
jgi:hypothetical protein